MTEPLNKDLKRLLATYEYQDGIIILQKLDEQGQSMACTDLTTDQARKCLSIAKYYTKAAGLKREDQELQECN